MHLLLLFKRNEFLLPFQNLSLEFGNEKNDCNLFMKFCTIFGLKI